MLGDLANLRGSASALQPDDQRSRDDELMQFVLDRRWRGRSTAEEVPEADPPLTHMWDALRHCPENRLRPSATDPHERRKAHRAKLEGGIPHSRLDRATGQRLD
ncbi:hypothetical protein B0T42_08675 [Rathayibacter sp. VKM Ac-2630]|nr:hypothetical protein B0T42_08675 [Rathayibacter sp. VKM Ac-2630]